MDLDKVAQLHANRVREVRKSNGLTQEKMAELIDVDKDYISKVERGERKLSQKRVKIIAKRFNVMPEWLLGLSEHKTLTEKTLAETWAWRDEWHNRLNAIMTLAHYAGYEIELIPDSAQSSDENYILGCLNEGYKIIHNGKVIATCSCERFNLLALHIQDLVDVEIRSYLREVTRNG